MLRYCMPQVCQAPSPFTDMPVELPLASVDLLFSDWYRELLATFVAAVLFSSVNRQWYTGEETICLKDVLGRLNQWSISQ